MNNHRTPAELKAALDAIVEELKTIEASAIADAELVPLVKSVQSVGAYVAMVKEWRTDMRIVNKANGRETTIGAAVSIVCDRDPNTALRDMVTRLLEELCHNADDTAVLRATSLARILEYRFKVED